MEYLHEVSKGKPTTHAQGGFGTGQHVFPGLLLEEREVGGMGAVEGGCRSTLSALAVRAFEKQGEAPGRDHPSSSTIPGVCRGAGHPALPARALFVPQPPSLVPKGGNPSPWVPAGNSVLTRVTVFGEPIHENGKFGESLLGEILIFGERERCGCLTGNVSEKNMKLQFYSLVQMVSSRT